MKLFWFCFLFIPLVCQSDNLDWQTSTCKVGDVEFTFQMPGTPKECHQYPFTKPISYHSYWLLESDHEMYMVIAAIGRSMHEILSEYIPPDYIRLPAEEKQFSIASADPLGVIHCTYKNFLTDTCCDIRAFTVRNVLFVLMHLTKEDYNPRFFDSFTIASTVHKIFVENQFSVYIPADKGIRMLPFPATLSMVGWAGAIEPFGSEVLFNFAIYSRSVFNDEQPLTLDEAQFCLSQIIPFFSLKKEHIVSQTHHQIDAIICVGTVRVLYTRFLLVGGNIFIFCTINQMGQSAAYHQKFITSFKVAQ